MLGVTIDVALGVVVIVLSLYNLFVALSIILTSGVGKNGSTVAVSPLLTNTHTHSLTFMPTQTHTHTHTHTHTPHIYIWTLLMR